jgi:hypothetical protein
VILVLLVLLLGYRAYKARDRRTAEADGARRTGDA